MGSFNGKGYSSLSEQLEKTGGFKTYIGKYDTEGEAISALRDMLDKNGEIYKEIEKLKDTLGSLSRYRIDAYPAAKDGGYCVIFSASKINHKVINSDESKEKEEPMLVPDINDINSHLKYLANVNKPLIRKDIDSEEDNYSSLDSGPRRGSM